MKEITNFQNQYFRFKVDVNFTTEAQLDVFIMIFILIMFVDERRIEISHSLM